MSPLGGNSDTNGGGVSAGITVAFYFHSIGVIEADVGSGI